LEEKTMAQVAREPEGTPLPTPGTYRIDPSHSAVEFVARHLMTKVRGRFTEFDGNIRIAERPEDSHVEVQIKADSIQTNQPQRDEHLRSGDFLGAGEHGEIRFVSRGLRPTGDQTFELDGDLAIRGVSRPVILDAAFLGATTDHTGRYVISFTAKTTISREDWGVSWNVALETGGWLVGKKVDIELEIEAAREE
jgi:polyisoprenoid-binding protein YceI